VQVSARDCSDVSTIKQLNRATVQAGFIRGFYGKFPLLLVRNMYSGVYVEQPP